MSEKEERSKEIMNLIILAHDEHLKAICTALAPVEGKSLIIVGKPDFERLPRTEIIIKAFEPIGEIKLRKVDIPFETKPWSRKYRPKY